MRRPLPSRDTAAWRVACVLVGVLGALATVEGFRVYEVGRVWNLLAFMLLAWLLSSLVAWVLRVPVRWFSGR